MADGRRIERRLAALGLSLPQQPVPVGNYLPVVRVGRLVFTSGQTARINGVRRYVGVVGRNVSEPDAYLSARDATLNCLACVKQVVGSLDRVTRVVRVLGFVNVGREFGAHPAVIDGASDLLERLFGEAATTRARRWGCRRCRRTFRSRWSWSSRCGSDGRRGEHARPSARDGVGSGPPCEPP